MPMQHLTLKPDLPSDSAQTMIDEKRQVFRIHPTPITAAISKTLSDHEAGITDQNLG